MIFWELFSTFFIIGLFNYGGGGTVLSLIQSEVVVKHGWVSQEAFANIVAISQTTPGPLGINCATYVGYEIAGIAGSALATIALVLPSFLVFFIIIKIFNKFHTSPVYKGTMRLMYPATAGLIASAAIVLIFNIVWSGFSPKITIIENNFPDWKTWVLFGLAFYLAYFRKVNPILILLGSAIIGLLIF